MSLKVSYCLLGYLLSGVILSAKTPIPINLRLDHPQKGHCEVRKEQDKADRMILQQNDVLMLFFHSSNEIDRVNCLKVDRPSNVEKSRPSEHDFIYRMDVTLDENMAGSWECKVDTITIRQEKHGNETVQRSSITVQFCSFTIVFDSIDNDSAWNGKWIFIGVGIIVVVIIVTQTGIILYFKAKARKMARIRRISQRPSTDVDADKKRYVDGRSAGQRESKLFAWLNKKNSTKDDNNIYETLEELRGDETPPVPPIETIPSLRTPLPARADPGELPTLPRSERSLPAPDISSLQRRRIPTPETASLKRAHAGREAVASEDYISKRPPLPLPVDGDQPMEDKPQPKANIHPQKMLPVFRPPAKDPTGGASGVNTKPKQVPISVVNELDTKLKMRQASALTPHPILPKKPQIPSKLMSLPSFRKKSTVSMQNQQFQLPEKPSPMPTGKSAVLLGLAPPPTKPKNPMHHQGFGPSVMPKPPPVTKPARPVPAKKPPAPLPVMAATPIPAMSASLSSKPPVAMPVMPASMSTMSAAPMSTAPMSTMSAAPMSTMAAAPMPAIPPASLATLLQAHLSTMSATPPAMSKPVPPPNQPIEEQIYEEYNEYEVDDQEQIYNSDEEWNYEPLDKFNIYSS